MTETVIERLRQWCEDKGTIQYTYMSIHKGELLALLAVVEAAQAVVDSVSKSSIYYRKPGDLSHVETIEIDAMQAALAELKKEAGA